MIIYVKEVSSNVGKNALCRKNGRFLHKMRWIQKPCRCPLMLKFDMQIEYGVIQKRSAAIFEILNFRNFSGGQSSNFCHFDKILDFDPLKNREKLKFQKLPHNVFCITSYSIYILNFNINELVGILSKNRPFFYKVHFSLHLTIPPSHK